MAVTTQDIIDIVNSDIGDSSNDRVTESDRLSAITEATTWLQEELANDHQKKTKSIDYSNIKHSYRLDDTIPDVTNATDLRIDVPNRHSHFIFKEASEVIGDVKNGSTEDSFGIDRFNGQSYLTINYGADVTHETVQNLDNTDDWEVADDAVNLTADSKETRVGASSLMFDVDVSASVNDKATIKSSSSLSPDDLTPYEDLSLLFLWVYIPDVADVTSISLIWGSGASDYWTDSATESTYGQSFSNGWNLVEFSWSDATTVGSPDPSAVDYYEMSVNYDGTQVDDTGFRFDGIQITLTQKMVFHYISYHIGEDNAGSNILEFTATDDVPFFSGQYDQYKFAVGHKASSRIFKDLRLRQESADAFNDARDSLDRYRKMFPTHRKHEVGGFKVSGLNFNK